MKSIIFVTCGLFDIGGTLKHCGLIFLSDSLPLPCTPSEYK